MSTRPVITPEELACLLAQPMLPEPARPAHSSSTSFALVHFGVALWLVKGFFLYAVMTGPLRTGHLDIQASHYLWMRGLLEALCLGAFCASCMPPQRRLLALGAMVMAATMLLMDIMVALTFRG